ncbi:hypothetical protein OAory_01097930 [Aspergillus oryzae]|uniref:Transcription factor domain-containing protein n=1 Tax=Aspergillus oryzae TaxID=5062 RepID=A0A1S9DHF0_ASPOZ|nr:hypothetical protein OAory_01097930 [Aspergillus oryzae]
MANAIGDPVSATSSVAAASQDASALSNPPLAAKNARRVEDEHGRLIVERGSTQYVTHEALISLGNQWPIYPLDSQSSELHAIGTLITESCYDTKLPLNINDSDLSTESSAPPDERIEFTESTFCLIHGEMTVLYRRSFLNAHPSNSEGHPSHLLDNRLRQFEESRTHLQNRYFQYWDTSIPVQWGTMTTRMPLIGISPDDPKRDQLLLTAIGVVEVAYLLETDPQTVRWAWLFERYPQWHAVVFVLTKLCGRGQSVETERAWTVLQKAIERWTRRECQKGGITLKTVHHFLAKAAVVGLGRTGSGSY